MTAQETNLLNAFETTLTGTIGASDLTMTDAQKKYRQDLRDITKTFSSLDDKDFEFPTKPS